MTRFKSDRQRKAVMSKVKNGQGLVSAVRKAVGLEMSADERKRLIKAYEREIEADKRLIKAGKDLPSTLLGEALTVTGKIRLRNDQKFLDRLRKKRK
ncbi:hypothetical protein GQ472_01795 [archaeon]|nr:hypothetical protein [archaeon]